jgi:hypothetical protein
MLTYEKRTQERLPLDILQCVTFLECLDGSK